MAAAPPPARKRLPRKRTRPRSTESQTCSSSSISLSAAISCRRREPSRLACEPPGVQVLASIYPNRVRFTHLGPLLGPLDCYCPPPDATGTAFPSLARVYFLNQLIM